MPLYISDFVLMNFGTGAVVGVPGHDKRDFEFAQKFNLPVVRVVVGQDGDTSPITRIEQVQEEEGTMVNSQFLNGMDTHQATEKIMDYIEKKGWGKRMVSYRLRDWCISRQRYWGPPIPMIYCASCAKKGVSWWETAEGKAFLEKHQISNPKSQTNSKSQIQNSKRFENWKLKIGNSDQRSVGWFPIPEEELPVLLPKVKDWRPKGEGTSPLAQCKEWLKVACPECGGPAKRETDVSDTFLDSSWYFLRYPSVKTKNQKPKTKDINQKSKNRRKTQDTSEVAGCSVSRSHDSPEVEEKENLPWNDEITRRWLPVDMYIGGAEHSVLHLMYSRFLTMVFKDLGLLNFEEPFRKFRAHGLLISEGAKMSKSKGNIVVPDKYIKKYGADTLRMYLMFLGPFSQGGDFRDEGIIGIYRFLSKVWRLVINHESARVREQRSHSSGVGLDSPGVEKIKSTSELKRLMHQTIKKVTEDIEDLKYNTAIAALMEFVNEIYKLQFEVRPFDRAQGRGSRFEVKMIKTLLLLLAPFAPHISEELYQRLRASQGEKIADSPGVSFGSPGVDASELVNEDFVSIHHQPWPKYDPQLIKEETKTIVVEVNGKVRNQIKLKTQNSKLKTEVEKRAKKDPKVRKYLKGKKIKQVIFVPGKLINFVTKR